MQRTARALCALAILNIGLAGGARAMMAPEYYRKARAEAPYHVQVAITKVDAPRRGPGTCDVTGKVEQVFKDATGKLPKGAEVGFPVACRRKGDEVPLGGTVWLDTDALEQAEFIEVYLIDGADGGFDVPLSNYRIIAAPSPAPQFPVDP
ncbi:MAG: hypothetical protein WDN31_23290 [Hyphomicrobium sp.]